MLAARADSDIEISQRVFCLTANLTRWRDSSPETYETKGKFSALKEKQI